MRPILYAETPARRTRQLVVDAVVLVWVLLWVRAGLWLHDLVLRLQAPGRSLEGAGGGLAGSLGDASRRVDDVPLAGRALAAPLDAASGAGSALAEAGRAQQDAVGSLALWLALLVAAAPIIAVLVRYLPERVRWVQRATAAAQLRGSAVDLDLFALRALVHRPLRELTRIGPDPAAAYRSGEPEVVAALARLELQALGLRGQPPALSRAGQGASTGRSAE